MKNDNRQLYYKVYLDEDEAEEPSYILGLRNHEELQDTEELEEEEVAASAFVFYYTDYEK